MVSSITYEAEKLAPKIGAIDGVHSVEFDATEAHYKTPPPFRSPSTGTRPRGQREGHGRDKVLLADYDTYISSEVGNPMEQTIKSEMVVVLGIASS